METFRLGSSTSYKYVAFVLKVRIFEHNTILAVSEAIALVNNKAYKNSPLDVESRIFPTLNIYTRASESILFHLRVLASLGTRFVALGLVLSPNLIVFELFSSTIVLLGHNLRRVKYILPIIIFPTATQPALRQNAAVTIRI